ncbi:MAG: hypothetical protein SFX18_05710 [Pirellulales bacterium]|nr:hypothetical protein [Pirellulales bacterium]
MPVASGATIYASGQLLIENTPGTHDDVRENRMYSIDTNTGIATPLPIWTNSTPAGLGGTANDGLLGFNSGQLVKVNPFVSNGATAVGGPAGVNATAFDVLADGRAFVVTTSGNRQLYQVDRVTGLATAIGPAGQIGMNLDSHFGLPAGTAQPFVISLGSIGDHLYGINLETGRQNLIRLNVINGMAAVIGAPDAVDGNDAGRYSGYSALAGVDENNDGQFDSLFGSVNFWNHDGDTVTPDLRLGGIARYDLDAGTWSLVGTNPGVIFFGMGSVPVPEPGVYWLLGICAMATVVAGKSYLAKKIRRVCGLLLVTGAVTVTATAAPLYNIFPVPLTVSGLSNQARGLNANGEVAGYDNLTGGFQRGLFYDGVNSPSTNIGLPAYTTAVTSSEGHAINDGKIIVGVGRYSAPAPGSSTGSVPYDRGIVFNANTNQFLAVIEPFNSVGGRRAFAQSINNLNRVVGNGSSDAFLTNQNPRRAFWYDVNPNQSLVAYKLDPAINGLPFLPGASWSVAYDVNEFQQITGFSQTPDDAGTPTARNRAVIWNAGTPDSQGNPYTTVTRIDSRNTAGTSSLARSINDAGVAVGRMTFSANFGDEAAFIYQPGDTGLTSLGFFGPTNTRTEALDIGPNNWIVGYAGATEGDSSNNNKALLWTPFSGGLGGYQATELLTLLPPSEISLAGSVGWTKLLEARAINTHGEITGYGRYIASPGGSEVTRGFVLRPIPEPGLISLAGVGVFVTVAASIVITRNNYARTTSM